MDREISAHLLRLRRKHPFFAALSMFARYAFTDAVERCETDGLTVRISPGYYGQLPAAKRTALLLHVTLHAALLHPLRRGLRHCSVWNTAADIVVNNMILDAGELAPPEGTAVEPDYRDLSVEQVYERLVALPRQHPSLLAMADAMCASDSGAEHESTGARSSDGRAVPGRACADSREDAARLVAVRYPTQADIAAPRQDGQPRDGQGQRGEDRHRADAPGTGAGDKSESGAPDRRRVETHWRSALRKAEAVARLAADGRDAVPAGLAREIDVALRPQLDWRAQLWRYLVRTPADFSGFDRRFVHQGLYLDALECESLKVYLAVDTSGSIDDRELSELVAEVRGVKRAYAFIDVLLYFADAGVSGPHRIDDTLAIPEPVGGGGTDFRPFFDAVTAHADPCEQALLVYLTDGDGTFPDRAPEFETLWVVTEGGEEDFPFGRVARLADRYQTH